MNGADKRVTRLAEATYWRALGKGVRAENIMNGTRDTFLDRLKKSYFGEHDEASANGAAVLGAGAAPVKGARGKEAEDASPAKVKARLPLPFYGLDRQTFRSREVLFTCVVGDRHFLQETGADLDHEHVLFADRELEYRGWDQRPLLFWDANPKLITLFHKYSVVDLVAEGTKMIWMDSRVQPSREVVESMFSSLDDNELCLFKHYERGCVYDETLAVLATKRATGGQCEDFSKHLRDQNFPRNAGLYETGLIGFRVCPAVVQLFRSLFGICYRYVPRDQLALPLALAKNNVKIHVYNAGETHLRNSPGVEVRSWKEKVQES